MIVTDRTDTTDDPPPMTVELLEELRQRALAACGRVHEGLTRREDNRAIDALSLTAFNCLFAYSTARERFQREQKPAN